MSIVFSRSDPKKQINTISIFGEISLMLHCQYAAAVAVIPSSTLHRDWNVYVSATEMLTDPFRVSYLRWCSQMFWYLENNSFLLFHFEDTCICDTMPSALIEIIWCLRPIWLWITRKMQQGLPTLTRTNSHTTFALHQLQSTGPVEFHSMNILDCSWRPKMANDTYSS